MTMLATLKEFGSRAVRWMSRFVPATKGDIRNLEIKVMKTLDDISAEVQEETTLIDSVSLLVSGLKQQVSDALAGAAVPAATQAKIERIFAALEANKAKLSASLVANTPHENPAPADSLSSSGSN